MMKLAHCALLVLTLVGFYLCRCNAKKSDAVPVIVPATRDVLTWRGGSTKSGGIFGSSKKKDANETSTSEEEKEEVDDDKKKKEKKPASRRRGWFGGSKKNETATKDDDDKEDEKKEEDSKKKKPEKSETKKTTKSPDPSPEDSSSNEKDTNTTTTTATTTTNSSSTPPPEGTSSVIVVGGTPSSPQYRVIRTASPGGVPQGTVVRSPGNPDKSVLVAGLLDALVRLATRVWILAWVAHHFGGHEQIKPVQHFVWERLNDRYTRDASVLRHVLDDPPHGVGKGRWELLHNWMVLRKDEPRTRPLKETFNRTVVVVSLASDPNGNLDLQFLTDVVAFLLQQFRNRSFGVGRADGKPLPLEVVLLVSSPGGSVPHYGLATAQVKRLAQEEGIMLTVCVDKTAASGGYMIASQSHKLLAAPFASLGSVGVMMEGLNFRELARLYGVNPIILKSGKYKNTISTFGPITSSDEKHENERLTKVHEAFQDLVIEGRPALVDRKVLEGQVFLGSEARELGLVDQILTSDEYIMERISAGDRVLRLHQSHMPRQQRRLRDLSPIDLLPFVRTRVSNYMASLSPEQVSSFLLTAGPIIGFANHVIRQIMESRSSS